MAENLTVARPYAEAAFNIAVEDKSLDKWADMLKAMALVCKDRGVMAAIKNASNAGNAGNILISLLKDIIDEKCVNLIRVIGENNRFEVIAEIYEEFLRLREAHDKVLTVQLISANPFAKREIDALKLKLAKKYGCSINFKETIDKSILGGAILKIGNEVIDASVEAGIKSLFSTLR